MSPHQESAARESGQPELSDVIDAALLQEMMNDYYRLTGIGTGIIDLNGTILVGTGWQDICVRFHRTHPESCRHCLESDITLSSDVQPGSFKAYRCKNNMWDMATPIMLAGRHVGNIFLGQFLYDDEEPDYELFRAQARQYGYDESAYLAALDRVPRWSRETVQTAMHFYAGLARMISSAALGNAALTESLRQETTDDRFLHHQVVEMEQISRCLSHDPATPPDGDTPGAAQSDAGDTSLLMEPDTVRRFLRGWSLIRERVRSAKAIEQAKQEWEQTFDAVPDLISIIDTQHKILRVNRTMAQRCGKAPDELIGLPCHEVVHGCSTAPDYCPHQLLMRDGKTHTREIVEDNLSGVFDITVSPLYHPNGQLRACVHVARDITQRKKAEQEQARLEEQLRHAQRMQAIGTLASGIAHDFNNIITAIVGYAHITQMGLPPDNPIFINMRQIMDAADRAAHLTRDLLLFSRKQPVNKRPLDLQVTVRKAEDFISRIIGSAISISIGSPAATPLIILGDEQQLGQVLMNLSTNARDAMPDGGSITIDMAEVTLTEPEAAAMGLARAGNYAGIVFSDSGAGIDPHKIHHIFDPFYTTKEPGKGTGLGLSIVYGIVKSHEGAIEARSAAGAGTTITIYLPLASGEASAQTVSLP